MYKDDVGGHGSPSPLGHGYVQGNQNDMTGLGCKAVRDSRTEIHHVLLNLPAIAYVNFSIPPPTVAHSLGSSFRELLL